MRRDNKQLPAGCVEAGVGALICRQHSHDGMT